MERRVEINGTGIQKVMKVSMRYAAGGCIRIAPKLRLRCRRSRDAVHIRTSSGRAARDPRCCVSRQDVDVWRRQAMAVLNSGGDFNGVVIDA
ncbi:hypothetical protein GPL21_31605 [Bradyrhizobium pachyrhizi]|uniref:Uncharacterized protein n=1 Tax=Bradyrhizobium pachyrhizi TaxID=280333 RepID=A0A844T282_9BRAD|nr:MULTISPECIES: hypothetical protein [Bradyrhizobium]MVT69632.1 hypothetical protein [Bradyrhizobium pachyrhizi]WFU56530.1 hypothetical protein QA639_03050 [Bradyrhizobium pachyrhizi]WOH82210.1 hypothetical protein RX327_03165 [Bradyrhizobium sp. BEA-2-5]